MRRSILMYLSALLAVLAIIFLFTYRGRVETPAPTSGMKTTSAESGVPVSSTASPFTAARESVTLQATSPPNPVVEYARERGLKDISEHLNPLGRDGRLDPEDKRLVDLMASLPSHEISSREFIETLDSVVADGKVTEDELSLLDDRYVNPEPPKIEELNLTPSRVVNGKVYELRLSFKAEDSETPIVSAILKWIPLKYGGMPSRAFPHEDARILHLTPVDGKYGNLREEFSIAISNFKGGREYEVRIEVTDEAGNRQVETIKTPYIRQYEDIAGQDSLLVGAYYYPWYGEERHWEEGYKGTPLLGEYDSRSPVVISRHIDWATGHGIDFFMVSWWGPRSYEDETLKSYLLKNPLAGSMRFAILYETGRLKGLSFAEAKKVLEEDFDYLNRTYFSDPRYLRIRGKPVVEIYLARALPKSVLEAIYGYRMKYGFYLLGDLVYWQNPSEASKVRYFDGVTSYNMHTSVPGILNDFEGRLREKYGEWLRYLRALGVDFIPSAIPGFDDRAVRSGNLPLPRSVERFKEQLMMALDYSWPRKIIMITSFNEWHEYTSIEPSVEYGMKYLEAVREVVGEYSKEQRGARGIVYILPSGACTSTWTRRYGDRIYFYVHANLSDYRDAIEEDFSVISEYYDTVIVIIPADDTQLFHHNLKVVSDIAGRYSLRILWGIFPKWKYGAEESYLRQGTPMNRLVVDLMEYLSSLDSTWRIAVWYGWKDRLDYREIIRFYNSLPVDLKGKYAVWLDEEYAPVVDGLATVGPTFLVVTELYSEEEIVRYSGRLDQQMVVTGYEGASNAKDWLNGICPKLRSIRKPAFVGIWMFYDEGDGSGESYGAYFPRQGLADPWYCVKSG